MKVVEISGVVLDFGMWVLEETIANNIVAETERTLDGGLIVFEQINRTSAKNITLQSRDDGWQKKETLDLLINLANVSINTNIMVKYDNGITEMARFRYEEQGGAVQFEQVYDGSSWYKGTIYMAKV